MLWFEIIKWVVIAIFKGGYMSTRISPNTVLGWTYNGNLALADKRANMLNAKVLNPAKIGNKPGWTGEHYMKVWRKVIRIMAVLGKPMYSFTEDLQASKGCLEEVELAKKIGMKIKSL